MNALQVIGLCVAVFGVGLTIGAVVVYNAWGAERERRGADYRDLYLRHGAANAELDRLRNNRAHVVALPHRKSGATT